jgi:hypothetical protein
MTLESFSDYLSGWLALSCAIVVFVAAALDAPVDNAPERATVVQAKP